jgi:hypothetical protein
MAKKKLVFHLSEGDYSETFIKILAMAIHLDLVIPSELTYWLENDRTIDRITLELSNRIKETYKK